MEEGGDFRHCMLLCMCMWLLVSVVVVCAAGVQARRWLLHRPRPSCGAAFPASGPLWVARYIAYSDAKIAKLPSIVQFCVLTGCCQLRAPFLSCSVRPFPPACPFVVLFFVCFPLSSSASFCLPLFAFCFSLSSPCVLLVLVLVSAAFWFLRFLRLLSCPRLSLRFPFSFASAVWRALFRSTPAGQCFFFAYRPELFGCSLNAFNVASSGRWGLS